MTYCVGVLLDQGLVLASDTRTNAGVDQVAIFPKMHIFEIPGERIITLMTSGNLAITQSIVRRLRESIEKIHSENLDRFDVLLPTREGNTVYLSILSRKIKIKGKEKFVRRSIFFQSQVNFDKSLSHCHRAHTHKYREKINLPDELPLHLI